MNIFKILANGDGTINEANVSAFLGYLLDPKADHALGYEFLSRFLVPIIDEDEKFIVEKYDYQIFFEQAFKEEGASKQIVDIVIVCYSIKTGSAKESLVKEFLSNSKEIHKIFLIENKIKIGSLNPGQLRRQFMSTKHEVADIIDSHAKLYSIYVTPDHKDLREEFENSKLEEATHIFWDTQEEDDTSIKSILQDLLEKEIHGKIEPLNEYTLHTIKAFTQFIDTDFRSEKEDKKERVNDGSYTKEYKELNIETRIEERLKHLKKQLYEINPSLNGEIQDPDLTRVIHPKLYLTVAGIRVDIVVFNKTRDALRFGYSVSRVHEESKEKLIALCDKLGLTLKKPNSKYGSYCRTEEMKIPVSIDDAVEVNRILMNAIDQIRS